MSERWSALRPAERLAALAAGVTIGSLLFPWYGIDFTFLSGISQTGFEALNFGHVALVVTANAAIWLIWRCAGGYVPPKPMEEGALLILAGLWMGLLICYLAVDRPDQIVGYTDVRPRYGILVAGGGAVALVVAGGRIRALRRSAK